MKWELHPFEELRTTLTQLRRELWGTGLLRDGQCAIFGSAVMVMHGLRERCGDVDLAVTPDLYAALAEQPAWEPQTPNPAHPTFLRFRGHLIVDTFQEWRSDEPAIDIAEMLREGRLDMIAGLPMIPLWLVRKHKVEALAYFRQRHDETPESDERQRKHMRDIELLDNAIWWETAR